MKILQGGYPKSGNYWLYKIISGVMDAAGIPRKRYIVHDEIYPVAKKWKLSYDEQVEIDMIDIFYQACFYRISSRYRNKIENLDEYVSKTNHVWTHSDYCARSREVFRRFDKTVYIIRDPRDIAISSAKFAFTPYMQHYYPTWHESPEAYLEEELEPICQAWRSHVTGHLESGDNIYFIFYENLARDFEQELDRLLDYLEIPLNDRAKNNIVQSCAFSRMKKENPGHVRQGSAYGWRKKLTSEQKKAASRITAPLLQRLGYPETDARASSPALKPAYSGF